MAVSETRREIAFADNTIGRPEIDAVTDVLTSGWLSADRRTRVFEEEFAAATGAQDAVFVSSGTAALHLAVLALGLRPGDEVIMPSLTFVAGAACCALHGVVPVLADIHGARDLTVDPADIERLITERTRAIVVMHYGGYPASVAQVRALADRHGLHLVEDAAHSPVVSTPDGVLGTVGDIGCFSFFATKNLTTGEGGMILARDTELLARVRSLRSHCIDGSSRSRTASGSAGYDVTGVGLNYRPTEMAAALGSVQLGRLAGDRSRRSDLVSLYHGGLAGISGLDVPFAGHQGASAHHLLPVLLPEGSDRERIRRRLRAGGVSTSVHYPPTHLMTYYQDDPDGLRTDAIPRERLVRTESVARRLLSLPLHARLGDDDVAYVVDQLADVLAGE
ncbi:DegT/DnrJ/EryC1/StrS family aminotransferase [Nonomuraea sp. B1E8]|uniref:DegT/DnrJ/EryC1/StrS family aminotransferase n=1 Tax=unclassified Nonomuraea TaxID=2593643 RepID=UPI00325DE190